MNKLKPVPTDRENASLRPSNFIFWRVINKTNRKLIVNTLALRVRNPN